MRDSAVGEALLIVAHIGRIHRRAERRVLKVSRHRTMTISAIIAFIIADMVRWPETLPTLGGAIAGSYIAARWAQRLDQRLVKTFVIILGAGLTVYFFVRGV